MKPDLNTIILILGFIFVWLNNKRDLTQLQNYLGDRIDRLSEKLDQINRTLGKHEAQIEHLKGTTK
jgi:hypothetical protein